MQFGKHMDFEHLQFQSQGAHFQIHCMNITGIRQMVLMLLFSHMLVAYDALMVAMFVILSTTLVETKISLKILKAMPFNLVQTFMRIFLELIVITLVKTFN